MQTIQNGIVGAIMSAQKHLENQDFLLLLGDEYYSLNIIPGLLKTFTSSSPDILIAYLLESQQERIKNNYTFIVKDTRLLQFIEKPQDPMTPFMGLGSIIFSKKVWPFFENAGTTNKSLELVDIFNLAIKYGLYCQIKNVN